MLYSTSGFVRSSVRAISPTSPAVICRASARGWTVMPCAPARRHSYTASSTDGTRPPREFRSVATLLTFTDSLITSKPKFQSPNPNLGFAIWSLGFYVLFDGVHDFLAPLPDFPLVAPLQHHPKERLGSGIADQQPSVSRQLRLDR